MFNPKKHIFAMLELGLPIFPVKIEKGLPFLLMWYIGLIDIMKVSLGLPPKKKTFLQCWN